MGAHFLYDAADQCGQQTRADAMAHDVAYEDAATRIRESDDVEEISAEGRCGHVAMRETERTVGGGDAPWKHGVRLRKKRLLNLAGHPHIGFHFLGPLPQFLLHPHAFGDVVADTDEADDIFADVAIRNFGRQRPVDLPLGTEIGFFLIEDRGAGVEHAPVVFHGLLAAFTREKIERGAAAGFLLVFDLEDVEVGAVVEDVVRSEVLDENATGEVIDDNAEEIALLGEFFFRQLGGGDVAGKAERSDDATGVVAPRHFCGGNPSTGAIAHGGVFDFGDDRATRADNDLFVDEGLVGVFAGEVVVVGFTHTVFRAGGSEGASLGKVVTHETALQILEINPVRDRVHQDVQNGRIEGLRGSSSGGKIGRRFTHERRDDGTFWREHATT